MNELRNALLSAKDTMQAVYHDVLHDPVAENLAAEILKIDAVLTTPPAVQGRKDKIVDTPFRDDALTPLTDKEIRDWTMANMDMLLNDDSKRTFPLFMNKLLREVIDSRKARAAVQGHGEAVRLAIEALEVSYDAMRKFLNGEWRGRDTYFSQPEHKCFEALKVLRALPAEAPPAGVDAEGLRKELYITCYDVKSEVAPDEGYGIIDRVVDRLIRSNRLQSTQPAKESGDAPASE